MGTYYYNKSSTITGDLNKDQLLEEIKNSSISTAEVKNISIFQDSFVTIFDNELSEEDRSVLDGVIAAHTHIPMKERLALIVKGAIELGTNLIIEFSAENMVMGITQAGKTKDVADYLSGVMRYAQSGSLYEVVNEMDRLITAGIPPELSPFVTEERLTGFKQKVLEYLT